MAWLRAIICALPFAQGFPLLDTRAKHNAAATDIPLRISPLGASVTWGTGSSHGNGYRGPLREALADAGYTVNFVGFREGGDMKDNENDGYPGLKVREIHDKLAPILEERKPNLFLINAGTNNCLQDEDEKQTDTDLGELLDDIWADNKDTTIILSGLLTNKKKDVAECEARINEMYKDRVADAVSKGFKITYADMSAVTVDDLGEDGTHPKDGGYEKFASGWLDAIQEVDQKGWITRAAHVEGIPDDGNKGTDPK